MYRGMKSVPALFTYKRDLGFSVNSEFASCRLNLKDEIKLTTRCLIALSDISALFLIYQPYACQIEDCFLRSQSFIRFVHFSSACDIWFALKHPVRQKKSNINWGSSANPNMVWASTELVSGYGLWGCEWVPSPCHSHPFEHRNRLSLCCQNKCP